HNKPPWHQALHDTQILPEQTCAWVIDTAPMVVDRVALARRASDQYLQFPLFKPRGTEKIENGEVLDATAKKRGFGVCGGEGCPGGGIVIRARKHVKARLAEAFAQTSSTAEKVNDRSVLTHRLSPAIAR